MKLNAMLSFSIAALLLSACAPARSGRLPTTLAPVAPTVAALAVPSSAPLNPLPTPQATGTATHYGPDAESFPSNINPMTGLPALDPALLKIPAVLVSISHFPATGRPQAGLSFAPFVYEFSITGGETRFLTAFYGQFPEPEMPLSGECAIRRGAFQQTGSIVGNRVWLDADADGLQDLGEAGIPGICVSLLDASGNTLQRTTTDTNGMFGFNVQPGKVLSLEFGLPEYLEFSRRDVGNDNADSDVDPLTGRTIQFSVSRDVGDWDAGMVGKGAPTLEATGSAAMPEAEVGPVRSGRLLYRYVAESYTNSCLIFAFASPEILARLPDCAFVAHEDAYGGDMISIERLKAVAEDNMRHTASRRFNYSSNLYSDLPSPGGTTASRLNVFFGNINQSAWIYDPLYKAYLRYVDNADIHALGVVHPEVDRLTNRQLHFENVIVVMADTDVVTRTNLDIHLDGGNSGPAMLFRDGQLFSISWSTRGGAYEKKTGFRKPIQFLKADGSPAALRPGHTWVIIVTPFSLFEAQGGGTYLIRYAPPAGEAQ